MFSSEVRLLTTLSRMADHTKVTDELFSPIPNLCTQSEVPQLYREHYKKRLLQWKYGLEFVLHFLCQFPCPVEVCFSDKNKMCSQIQNGQLNTPSC